jgi:hypothetical protein
LHWLPAIRRPDTYRNWTFTSEQTMIYQDTPRFVSRVLLQYNHDTQAQLGIK